MEKEMLQSADELNHFVEKCDSQGIENIFEKYGAHWVSELPKEGIKDLQELMEVYDYNEVEDIYTKKLKTDWDRAYRIREGKEYQSLLKAVKTAFSYEEKVVASINFRKFLQTKGIAQLHFGDVETGPIGDNSKYAFKH